MEVAYVKGVYTWTAKRRRTWGKQRWMMGICKGETLIAILCYHPVAKQVVVDSVVNLTLESIDFLTPYLDLQRFNTAMQIHAHEERIDSK